MPGGHKFPFATGERRIIHQHTHADRRWIDIYELQGRTFLAIGQRFADINFLEASQADDVARAGMFDLDLLETGVGEEGGDRRAFAAAVAMNAHDRIAYADPAAHNPAQGNPAKVIIV